METEFTEYNRKPLENYYTQLGDWVFFWWLDWLIFAKVCILRRNLNIFCWRTIMSGIIRDWEIQREAQVRLLQQQNSCLCMQICKYRCAKILPCNNWQYCNFLSSTILRESAMANKSFIWFDHSNLYGLWSYSLLLWILFVPLKDKCYEDWMNGLFSATRNIC